jgi:hypothetical protein
MRSGSDKRNNLLRMLDLIFIYNPFIFTPAAESQGIWRWMNAPTFSRDVAPLAR